MCFLYKLRACLLQAGSCRYNSGNVGASITGYSSIPVSEAKLMIAVATIGPISVAIYANTNFQHYGGGIYYDTVCTSSVNQAVLVVGYGTTNGVDYWLVKNRSELVVFFCVIQLAWWCN